MKKTLLHNKQVTAKILAMYRSGAEVQTIADKVGFTVQTVYSYLSMIRSEGVLQTNRPKKDCFAWDPRKKKCSALTELFCRTKAECPFYKTSAERSRELEMPTTIELIIGGMQ